MPSSKIRSRFLGLWGLVPVLVALELFAQWRIAGDVPTPEDWEAAARAVRQQKEDGDLVVIAPKWATHGRMYLKDLISINEFGRFDATRYKRIIEVSLNRAAAPETRGLQAGGREKFGKVSVVTYPGSNPALIHYDFVGRAEHGTIDNQDAIRPRIVVDHWFNPRLVIPVKLEKQGVNIRFAGVPVDGGVIRGYGIVGYRSGRFDKGGSIKITAFVGEQRIGEHVVENFGPKGPFEFAVQKREAPSTVRFEIRATDGLNREFGFAADIRSKAGGAK